MNKISGIFCVLCTARYLLPCAPGLNEWKADTYFKGFESCPQKMLTGK